MNRLEPLFLLSCLLVVGSLGCRQPANTGQAPGVSHPSPGGLVSNVTRADYAGSEACVPCHMGIAASFDASPMHRMTRDVAKVELRAPFGGDRLFRFGAQTVSFHRQGDHAFVAIESPGQEAEIYRVTKVIGGTYREDYVGRRVREVSEDPVHIPGRQGLDEVVLPVTWHFRHGEWRYKGYSVQIPERERLHVGPRWSKSCIFCHNLAPYLSSIYDDLGDFTERRFTYQGSVPSNLLPEARRLRFDVHRPEELTAALRAETAFLGRPPPSPEAGLQAQLGHALVATQGNFDEGHLIELGIGCESCHNGSRAHAEDPAIAPDFRPRHPAFEVKGSDGGPLSDAQAQSHVCARCHSVLFSAYEFTWEGGRRRDEPGGSAINSGEARDFLLGGCATRMTCTSCHDPHARDDKAAMKALSTPAGNRVCLPCHEALAEPEALRAHSHHDPGGAGGACIACHMAPKNVGLNYDIQPYHRIGSPTDPSRVEGDRPLECALCHAEKSVAELVEAMEDRHGPRYSRERLRALYGDDLSVNALLATLTRGHPHERPAAIAALARTGDRRHGAAIALAFQDPLPLTRYMAREALGALFGAPPSVDMSLPRAELAAAIEAWLEAQQP